MKPGLSMVKEEVEQGVQEVVDKLRQFDEINEKFGEELSDDEMNKLIERQGEVQEQLDRMSAWDLDSRLDLHRRYRRLRWSRYLWRRMAPMHRAFPQQPFPPF